MNELFSISLDCGAPVRFNEAKIQPGGRPAACSTLPRAEGMKNPILARESGGLDPSDALT